MNRLLYALLLLGTILLPVNNTKAQESTAQNKHALELLEKKDLKAFDVAIENLYAAFLKDNLPQYAQAVESAKDKKYSEAYQNLDSLVAEGYLLDELPADANFKDLHNRNDWKLFKKRLSEKLAPYNNTVRLQLRKIQNRDQGIRVLVLYAKQAAAGNKELQRQLNDYMKKIDAESATEVRTIIDRYGWMGADEIGSEASQTLFLAIQHVDDLVVQQRYLPLLSEAVKNNKAEPWQLAFLTDRILMNQGKKQIYGTQVITSKNEYGPYVVPLEDIDKVDELRARLGLPPLKDYLEEFDMEWDVDRYKKDFSLIEKQHEIWFKKQHAN